VKHRGYHDIGGLPGEAIAEKELSPVDLVQRYLGRPDVL